MVLAVASQSEATVPSLRKRKALAPDASVTSSGAIPISVLIENADMEDLIKVYQVAKKHDPIYIRIQEFLTRVSLILFSFFYLFPSSLCKSCNQICFSFAILSLLLLMRHYLVIRLEHTVLVAVPLLPGDIQGLIYSLRMSLRISLCLGSLTLPLLLGTYGRIITSRHSSVLHRAIFMMMRLSSSSIPPSLKS